MSITRLSRYIDSCRLGDLFLPPTGRTRPRLRSQRLALFAPVVALLLLVGEARSEPCEAHFPFGAPAEIYAPKGDRITVCQKTKDESLAFFVSRYDRDRRSTDWTAYRLTRELMIAAGQSDITRREHGVPFAADPQIETDTFASPNHNSFTGIGNLRPSFDRGHLAPAEAFKWKLEGYQRTFIVTNIAIQAGWFNQQLWQDVEAQVRGWACNLETVYVLTGTVHGHGVSTFPLRDRDDESHIPVFFYTLAYTPHDGGRAVAVIFPNVTPPPEGREIPVTSGAIPVATLQAITGIDFFPGMDDDDREPLLSAQPDASFWRFDYPRRFECQEETQ